ncbi:hypothetical protein JK163_13120 [Levilactobacillus brevis]|uniref:hypothetical protein n=1 Tax=Levilactobacillus brevis TaxID=1580 RepID=UPI001BAC01EF|nr:hypothetical protein [Levilactobacillus brevis]MBS1007178.1 hypothetical protein [Levilactobacillus brevis]
MKLKRLSAKLITSFKKYFEDEVPGLFSFRFFIAGGILMWIESATIKRVSNRILGYIISVIILIDLIVLLKNLVIGVYNVRYSLKTGAKYHFLTESSEKKLFILKKTKNFDVKKVKDYMDNRFLPAVFLGDIGDNYIRYFIQTIGLL